MMLSKVDLPQRGAHQDEELARRDVDVHAAQNLHAFVAAAKALVDACNFE